jgi:hypothetical protein
MLAGVVDAVLDIGYVWAFIVSGILIVGISVADSFVNFMYWFIGGLPIFVI